ncbi:MAG: DNA adenine methylase [Luteolibacter sp.]
MSTSTPEPIAPFLRWAGSKRAVAGRLSSYWNPSYNRYIEPFVGSACVFFKINPRWATLGDLNSELITTFKELKTSPELVSEELGKLKKSKSTFLRLRKADPSQLAPETAAARFIYLNRYCFNGLYRTNLSGQFNVPYAPQKSGSLPTPEQLIKVSKRLKHKKLLHADFQVTLADSKEGSFSYIDPPYLVESKRVFKEYGARVFSSQDLERLVATLQEIDKKGGAFLLSYADCKEAREMFREWPMRRMFVARNISGFARNRRRSAELLFSNRDHPKH